ncbi:hypothetical protein ACLF6K_05545 [Streptomyces xanthophaeus]|uniref:hypothetical protein n=1 Tax=Streptomyces xanthophaeus TaxID=67385 RepID=UPI00398FB207
MRRTMSAAGAAIALTGLITAAGPATAAPATCTPKIQVLGHLTPDAYHPDSLPAQGVLDLGAGNLAVGVSGSKPVYWTGTRLHRVPLPDATRTGEVLAVNRNGLMVGRLVGDGGYLFTYRAGDAAVTPLPGSDWSDQEADVNDAGHVVARSSSWVGTVWKDGQKVRELPVPDGADPGTRIKMVTAINARGDILGQAKQDYEVPETGEHREGTYPVLWPADGGPAKALVPTSGNSSFAESYVQDLDESGRIVGYDWLGPWHEYKPWVWAPPHTGPGTSPGVLNTHPYGTFEAISPTTGVSVGTAKFHPESRTLPDQAQLWSGTGPVLALPRLAAGGASTAEAVSDDGRVGGSAVNANGKHRPVIWTCAVKQAYLPQS